MSSSPRATVRTAVALIFFALGCASDKELVTSGLAARHYEAGTCARLCCETGTGVWIDAAAGADGKVVPGHVVPCAPLLVSPPECPQFKRDLNAFLDELALADDTVKIGPLPKNARARLKAAQAAAEKEGKP